jgi:predicted ATPase
METYIMKRLTTQNYKNLCRGTTSDKLAIEVVQQRWSQVLTEVKARDLGVEALLNAAHPTDVRDGVIILNVAHEFARNKLSQKRTKQLVEDVLSKIYERTCQVEYRIEGSPSDVKRKPDIKRKSGVNLQFNNLNIFIGPNGSGKSNLIGVLRFLKDATTAPLDETRGRTGFDDAIFGLGGSRILDASVESPANVGFEFEFVPTYGAYDGQILELELLVQDMHKKVIISQESLYSNWTNVDKGEPFCFYQCHDRTSGQGVVAVYDDPSSHLTHFEQLPDVPVDDLALVTIPKLLENSEFPPENTPIYQMRRQLIDIISQWRFYNANDMDLKEIRHSEPKIGPGDVFLSSSGKNLALALDNLIQKDLDFEESINNAMKAILPSTRRIRAVRSGRLSLTIEWHFDNVREPFYLNEMSDGTVRMLCWATILLSPELPSLLVIDEPELGIHVAWMQTLAEWIKQAATRTQVIVSTHSPDLLDHFTDQVENVFVFHPAGKDHFAVKPLSAQDVSEWLQEGWQLGDLYRVGDPSVGGWPW